MGRARLSERPAEEPAAVPGPQADAEGQLGLFGAPRPQGPAPAVADGWAFERAMEAIRKAGGPPRQWRKGKFDETMPMPDDDSVVLCSVCRLCRSEILSRRQNGPVCRPCYEGKLEQWQEQDSAGKAK